MRSTMSRLFTALALVLTAFAVPERVSATPARYFARGSAQFLNANDFVGTGFATHLGNYTEVGNVGFAGTNDPDVLAVSGTNVYTAANGDELRGHLDGTLNTATGAIAVTVTYTGGTGRFIAATGASNLVGQMLGGGRATVSLSGIIDF